ncbi:FkbM family methyltransferase [Novosphingobium olei]|uniref:FkbM family methyltransferase n=1 Tax=Novosphingobium olei TaxID=2728851 RepID=A0A7Y0GAS9_9SPHN|nr:FkbM family methyltransferase [Novosphingobium olei]NML95390.1 FkbM family methyltransferase [Novosphingobium olei]
MVAHEWIDRPAFDQPVAGLPPPIRASHVAGAEPGRLVRLWRRLCASVALNLKDARQLGPAVLLRHLARLSGTPQHAVQIRGHGRFEIRRHESDLSVLREVFGEGAYALDRHPHLAARLERRYRTILAAGRRPVVLDCGANIGAATVALAELWPRAAFVAVEPDPGNAAMARRNLIGTPNAHVLEAAIGSVPGHAALLNDGDGFAWGVRTTRAASGVPIITVRQALEAVQDGEPFVCKIDIEGFEEDLFARDTGWIDQFEIIMVEPHDWLFPGRRSSRHLQRAMADRGMEMIVQGHSLFYLRP